MESDQYLRGITLFNQADFFDAHEVLEDVWRAAPPENKKFLQGLIQVAVAFHHYSTGNRVGMRSVLERAIRNLSEPSGTFRLDGACAGPGLRSGGAAGAPSHVRQRRGSNRGVWWRLI